MRFGVDIDGVLADFQGGWAEAYELWWPGKLDFTKLDKWDSLETETHFERREDFWTWTDDADIWRQLRVVDGAQGALYDLQKKGVMIELVTARKAIPRAQAATYEWLDKHFGFVTNLADRIHHTGNKASVPCSLYVDDSPHELEKLAHAGKTVIRYDRPWNQGTDIPGALARNWKEVTEMVEALL